MAFASLTAQLRLDTADFGAKLAQAGARVGTFGKNLGASYATANKELGRHTLGLKDTARIVQGIIISQTFYAIAGSIRDATSALTQFNEKLDYAKVTYSALFGSSKLAEDFVKVLQEKSVNSIFDYETLADASKKMLAYGIDYKNLGFILDGLMNLGAMSGDTASLDRIALALGQIQAKGKLSAEEMRQLANAYVPIQEIVKEGFNLTPDQMKSVGDLNLPAHAVINEIIDYANERFGDVGESAMYTITGLKNRIVDTMKVLGSEMIMPLTRAWKSFLKFAADGLQGIRESFGSRGWAGVFESLVPDPAMQGIVRSFLANVHNGILAIMRLIGGLWPLISQVGNALAIAFSMVSPVIHILISVLGSLLKVMSQNGTAMVVLRVATILAAGAFAILKARALGALVITAVTKAVAGLSKALIVLSTLVTKHPIIMLIAGLALALVGVAAASNNADNGLKKLFDTLSGTGGGLTQKDIFKETTKDIEGAADAADQFNNRLGDGAEELEDDLNKAGKAAKKTAGLLSFDEVFKLSDDKKDSGTDPAAGITDLIDGFSGLGGALIPDIPDFSEFVDNFTDTLFGDLFASVSRVTSGALTGVLIGTLVGFAIGGLITKSMSGALAGAQLGMKIGAAAGAGFAAFWGDTYTELERTLQNIALGSGVMALTGGLVGLLIGAFATRTMAGAMEGARIGASIGTLAGAALGVIFEDFGAEIERCISAMAWGGAEGALVGALAGMMLGAFATRTLAGAMTGARYGTAIGSLIGGAIGAAFGDAEAGVATSLENMFANIQAASMGSMIGALAGLIIGAIVGAFAGGIGALPGAKLGASLGSVVGGLGVMLASYLETSGFAEAFGEWFANLTNGVNAWLANLWNAIATWFANVISEIARFFVNLWVSIVNGLKSIWDSIITWFSNLWADISAWFSNVWSSITTWFGNLWSNISAWFSNVWSSITTWFSNLWTDISAWFSNAWNNVTTWFKKLWTSISTWFSNVWNNVTTWFKNLWTNISAWLSNVWSGISTWLSNVWSNISKWFSELAIGVKDWWNNLWDISKWKAGWDSVKQWFTNLWTGISSWFTDLGKSVANWWDSLWSDKKANVTVNGGVTGTAGVTAGHATGGIFNREHIARFAEGNKAEAVIPLENASAMQPFVNAISQGILEGLAPTLVQSNQGSSNGLPPMYVGTLVADERGLKQLYKKFELIQIQENARRGTT